MGIFIIIAAIAIVVVTSPIIPSKVFLFTNSTKIDKTSAKIIFNVKTIHNVDNFVLVLMANYLI